MLTFHTEKKIAKSKRSSQSAFSPAKRASLALLWFISLSLALTTDQPPAHGSEPAGTITKVKGTVLLFHGGEVRGKTVDKENTAVIVHDSVKTKRHSSCYIRFIDQSKIILTENSSLTVHGIDHANVDEGKVLFDIKKRGQVKGLNISTATITIGVKGTRFAVYKQGDKLQVFLKEGELEIGSSGDAFKMPAEGLHDDYKQFEEKLRDEFEATRDKMHADFEESKRQMQEGNAAYLKAFDMSAGSAISIDENNEVFGIKIPQWVEEDFALLDDFDQ